MTDTSVEYREMLLAWPEMQEEHKWEDGDWRYYQDNCEPEVAVYHGQSEEQYSSYVGKGDICLFRQDQLQTMVREQGHGLRRYVSDIQLASDFGRWVEVRSLHDMGTMAMEQLWLCFVMWELHSKLWDGKEWVDGQGNVAIAAGVSQQEGA